jgi:hypothetical protein
VPPILAAAGWRGYVIFAVLLFYALTMAGSCIRRRTRWDPDRLYRAVGCSVLPASHRLMAGVIEVLFMILRPAFTLRGFILVPPGFSDYGLWRPKEGR